MRGALPQVRRFVSCPTSPYFFIVSMIANINNFGVINFYENNDSKKEATKNTKPVCEDITPAEDSSVSSDYQSDSPSSIDSFIFTKKAKNEGKIDTIIQSLQKSVQGRKDKTRAFVQKLHGWQDDGYVDAHYNARVMYDELERLIPIPFGYDVFRRLYNSSRC